MTILEASAHLYKWFNENDSFSIEKDFMKIIAITEEPNRDKVAFKCALKQLKKMKMIRSEFSPDDHIQYWILNKSFAAFEQNVVISSDLAITISDIVNKFCEATNNDVDICDHMNIEEKDIKNLIYIANMLVTDKDQGESSLD